MVIRKPVALWLMKKSIFMDKKLLIPAVVVIGLIATYLVATPVLAGDRTQNDGKFNNVKDYRFSKYRRCN